MRMQKQYEEGEKINDDFQKRIIQVVTPVVKHTDGMVAGKVTISKTGTVMDIHIDYGKKNLQSDVRKTAQHWSFRPSDKIVTVSFMTTFLAEKSSYTKLWIPYPLCE